MGVEVAPLEADLAKKNEYEHNRMQGSTYNFGNQDNVNAQTQNRLGQIGGSSSLFANQQQNWGNSGYQNSGFNFNPNNPNAQSTNNTAFGFVRHQDRDNNYNQNNNNNPGNNNNSGNNNYM